MRGKKDGGPAFPTVGMTQRDNQALLHIFNGGMALRDYFAAAALQGQLAATGELAGVTPQDLATDAYRVADAMLVEREKV